MPNLVPPLTSVEMVQKYHGRLKAIDPHVTYFMTLYLHPSLTPEEITKAARSGIITGVKSYPRGVTTNSDGGIESYEAYYPIFEAMQKENLILHLHGEVPSNPESNVCVLNAEELFLKHLKKLHQAFPRLRIILEHVTTKTAVELVRNYQIHTAQHRLTAAG